MAYATYTDVRNLTPLTTTDIADAALTTLITYATAQVNNEFLTHVEEEDVQNIDAERQNKINGSNTVFYTKNKPLADLDDDGDIDASDVTVYSFASDGTRSTLTVSSVSADLGKVTLSSAPSTSTTSKMKMTYRYSPENIKMSTVNQLVKSATVYLTAAMAYTKIAPADIQKYTLDRLSVTRFSSETQKYMKLYQETMKQLKAAVKTEKKGFEAPTQIPQFGVQSKDSTIWPS